MDKVAFITSTEREIYREYDRQRRLRLTLRVAPIFGILLGIAFIAATIYLIVFPPIHTFSI